MKKAALKWIGFFYINFYIHL